MKEEYKNFLHWQNKQDSLPDHVPFFEFVKTFHPSKSFEDLYKEANKFDLRYTRKSNPKYSGVKKKKAENKIKRDLNDIRKKELSWRYNYGLFPYN